MITLCDCVLTGFCVDGPGGCSDIRHRAGQPPASCMSGFACQNLCHCCGITGGIGVIRTGALQRISFLVMKGHTGEHLVLSNGISGQVNEDLTAEDNLTVSHNLFSLHYSDAI